MEVRELVCFLLLYRRYKRLRRRERRRRLRANPISRDRLTNGMFVTLYPKLREQAPNFLNFGMSIKSFDELLNTVKTEIMCNSTVSRDSVSPEEKLVITLRFLVSGCSFWDLHNGYRLEESTISHIVEQVCSVMWEKLKVTYMLEMTTQKWREVAASFEKHVDFPNCIGAVDGKHIELMQSPNIGLSLILLAVCDTKYNFLYVDIEGCGKNNDSTAFQHSTLHSKLVENTLKIPDLKPIPDADETSLPHFLVGSRAFGVVTGVMHPYGGEQLTYAEKVFNYRVSRVLRVIECTFALMSSKWQIFDRPIDVNITFAEKIIRACTVLHNYVISKDGYKFEDTLYTSILTSLNRENVLAGSLCATPAREKFANYFINEGKIPWQDKYLK